MLLLSVFIEIEIGIEIGAWFFSLSPASFEPAAYAERPTFETAAYAERLSFH